MWFKLTGDERLERCATDGCYGQPTMRLEADGIGSNYCSGCHARIVDAKVRRATDKMFRTAMAAFPDYKD